MVWFIVPAQRLSGIDARNGCHGNSNNNNNNDNNNNNNNNNSNNNKLNSSVRYLSYIS